MQIGKSISWNEKGERMVQLQYVYSKRRAE